MNTLKNGWFSEISALWAGQTFSIEVDEILHEEKSNYQDILVLQTPAYGKVLILDGVIQCTEKDEFSYQEMISFLPLNSHPNPKNVLIIGGGDGGVAREVLKYPTVETIVQCEIDTRVIEVSKKYLPFMAQPFTNPKLKLHIGDGYEFMSHHLSEFDVIITDSSDPIGPAESLYQEEYYRGAFKALRPGGILCCQGENMWYHAKLISTIIEFGKEIYQNVKYAYTCLPTYPGGQIGFLLFKKGPIENQNGCFEPKIIFTEEELDNLKLRYYSPEIHRASFVLPRFAKKSLFNKSNAENS